MTSHMASLLLSPLLRAASRLAARIFNQGASPIGVDVKVVSTPGEGDPPSAPIIKA